MLKMVFAYHAKYNKRNSKYQFWIQNNHPIYLETPMFIRQKLDYIHLNPVRAGIVNRIEEYVYSSAANYETGSSTVIDIELIDVGGSDVGYVRV